MPLLDINVGTSGRTEYNPWTQKCIRRKPSTKRSKSKPRVSFAIEVPTTDWGCLRRQPPTPFYPRSPSRDMQQCAPKNPSNNFGYVGDVQLHQGVAHPSREHAQPVPKYQEPIQTPTPQYHRPLNTLPPSYAPVARRPPPRHDEFGRSYQDMNSHVMTDPILGRPAHHGNTGPIYSRDDGRRRSSLPELTYEPRYRASPPIVDEHHLQPEVYSRSLPRGRPQLRMSSSSRRPVGQDYEYEQRHIPRPRSRSRSRHVFAREPRGRSQAEDNIVLNPGRRSRSRSRNRNTFARTPRKDYGNATRSRSILRSRPAPFRESRHCEDNQLRHRNKYANSFSDSSASETSTTVPDGSYISPSSTRYFIIAPRRSF